MTACFKLMKALQPDKQPGSSSFCEQCVYFSGNLDSSHFSSKRTFTTFLRTGFYSRRRQVYGDADEQLQRKEKIKAL